MIMTLFMTYVVTDWSFSLAGFLVSTLFGVSSANPSNFSRCKCFSSRIPFLFQYNLLVVLMLANVPCYTVFIDRKSTSTLLSSKIFCSLYIRFLGYTVIPINT